ncbi:MAG: RNAse P, Rpr2/Rpp21 subunit [Sulfolobales archaeon]|nr:RNAse P, Rpr2/Rpp21 subunit [Sulfolobales archaeon]MCX8186314.1 RNAse P, Rpr2/Rpp21 subunit [Sulfolobales archaeon]MDW7968950.1 RNAse P, Rpr2/Rpp21 subunit [Sulfolobales archaeon]
MEALQAVKSGNVERARRYVGLALKIINRSNTKMPKYLKRGTCKKCLTPLIPGLTARYRVRGVRKYVIISKTCLACGWVSRLWCRKTGK